MWADCNHERVSCGEQIHTVEDREQGAAVVEVLSGQGGRTTHEWNGRLTGLLDVVSKDGVEFDE